MNKKEVKIANYTYPCKKCGQCCRKVGESQVYADLDNGAGICRFLNVDTNLCEIYENRPLKCNVVDAYALFEEVMSFSQYIDLNLKYCKKIRKEGE